MVKKAKLYAAQVAKLLMEPQLRPLEVKLLRAAGAAILAYLGIKYA